MGRLGDVTLGDLVRALGRYRPAIVAVAVMVIVFQLLPDRTPRVASATRSQRPASTAGGPQVAGDDTSSDDDAATGDAEGDFDEDFEDDEVAFDDSEFDDSGEFDDDPTFDDEDVEGDFDEDFEEDDSSLEDGDDDVFGGDGDDPGGLDDDIYVPLAVFEYGWATATAGTPVASSDVPEGTMPVGKRIGQTDKISFVRVIGTSTLLELHEASEGQRTPPVGEISVQLCQSEEDDWSGGDAQTFDEAPSWDADQCVDGVRSDDGTWTFDVSGFESADDRRGLVLVPGADSAVDFQVAFEPR